MCRCVQKTLYLTKYCLLFARRRHRYPADIIRTASDNDSNVPNNCAAKFLCSLCIIYLFISRSFSPTRLFGLLAELIPYIMRIRIHATVTLDGHRLHGSASTDDIIHDVKMTSTVAQVPAGTLTSLLQGLVRHSLLRILQVLSRHQTIDKVGQLFGRGLVSEDNRPMKSLNHGTCHLSKKWQTTRTPTLLCCFIF